MTTGCASKVEMHLHVCCNRHRLAIQVGRLEAPLLNGFDGLLIQAHAQRTDDLNILRQAVFVYGHLKKHRALPFCSASFFGVLGFNLYDWDRGCTAADAHSLARCESASQFLWAQCDPESDAGIRRVSISLDDHAQVLVDIPQSLAKPLPFRTPQSVAFMHG